MVQESDGGRGEMAGECKSPWEGKLFRAAWLGPECSERMARFPILRYVLHHNWIFGLRAPLCWIKWMSSTSCHLWSVKTLFGSWPSSEDHCWKLTFPESCPCRFTHPLIKKFRASSLPAAVVCFILHAGRTCYFISPEHRYLLSLSRSLLCLGGPPCPT